MIVHIDGDVIVYRAGFAAEHTYWSVRWPEGGMFHEREFESRKDMKDFMDEYGLNSLECSVKSRREAEPVENALFNVRSIINSIIEKTGAMKAIVYLSGPTNFRDGVATIQPYKGNRDPDAKPVHAAEIKQMMRRTYDCKISDGQEADDDMAIAHWKLWIEDPYSSCIATIDKDLNMVPGMHYNFVKDERYYVEPEEGLRWFQTQLLIGDTVDNIPGIRGIGPKKAEKILDCDNVWEAIAEEYVKCYGGKWKAALQENGVLLWMRIQEDQWWQLPPEVEAYGDGTVDREGADDDSTAVRDPSDTQRVLEKDGGVPDEADVGTKASREVDGGTKASREEE